MLFWRNRSYRTKNLVIAQIEKVLENSHDDYGEKNPIKTEKVKWGCFQGV